jgi:urea transport system permease protein
VNFGKSWFTSVLPEIWLFALGGMFLAVTLFLPQGLAGLFKSRARKPGAEPMPAAQPEAAE